MNINVGNYNLSNPGAAVHCPHCGSNQPDGIVDDFIVPESTAQFKTACESCNREFTVQYAGGVYQIKKVA